MKRCRELNTLRLFATLSIFFLTLLLTAFEKYCFLRLVSTLRWEDAVVDDSISIDIDVVKGNMEIMNILYNCRLVF